MQRAEAKNRQVEFGHGFMKQEERHPELEGVSAQRGGQRHTQAPSRASFVHGEGVCVTGRRLGAHQVGGHVTSPPPRRETGSSHGLTWSITAPHLRAGMSSKEQLDEAKVCVHSLRYGSKRQS